jgi:hypothetical protein
VFDLIELLTHWHAGRSQRQISESLGIDRKTNREVSGAGDRGVGDARRGAGHRDDLPPIPVRYVVSFEAASALRFGTRVSLIHQSIEQAFSSRFASGCGSLQPCPRCGHIRWI